MKREELLSAGERGLAFRAIQVIKRDAEKVALLRLEYRSVSDQQVTALLNIAGCVNRRADALNLLEEVFGDRFNEQQ